MKISEAIAMVDAIKPNQYTEAQKIGWLSQIDGGIFREIIETHVDPDVKDFKGYATDVNKETEMLAPYPYAEDVYSYYLQSMIDLSNGEIGKYNQSCLLYNSAYQSLSNWYNRTHMPVSNGNHFKF